MTDPQPITGEKYHVSGQCANCKHAWERNVQFGTPVKNFPDLACANCGCNVLDGEQISSRNSEDPDGDLAVADDSSRYDS